MSDTNNPPTTAPSEPQKHQLDIIDVLAENSRLRSRLEDREQRLREAEKALESVHASSYAAWGIADEALSVLRTGEKPEFSENENAGEAPPADPAR